MRCINCGNEVEIGAYECPYCAQKLRAENDIELFETEITETVSDGAEINMRKRRKLLVVLAAAMVILVYWTVNYAVSLSREAADNLFNEGLVPVYADTLWGYAGKDGRIKIDTKFNSAYAFSKNGLALASIGTQAGYINKNGKFLSGKFAGEEFVEIGFFSDEGLAFAKNKTGDYGYINSSGEWAVSPKYDGAKNFKNGCAAVKIGERWGYINKDGIMISDFVYDEAGDFAKNSLAAVKKDGYWSYIDKTGKTITDKKFEEANDFKNGLAAVKMKEGWNYIDGSGNVRIEINAEAARDFSDYAAVKIGGLWGYINKSGKIVIEPQFLNADKFSHKGYAAVKTENGMGIINKKGRLITDDNYYSVSVYDDGYAVCSENGERYEIIKCFGGRKIGGEYNFISYDRTYNYTSFARYYIY